MADSYKSLRQYWEVLKNDFRSDKEKLKTYSFEQLFLFAANVILYFTLFTILAKFLIDNIEFISVIKSDKVLASLLVILSELLLNLASGMGLIGFERLHIKELVKFEVTPLYQIYCFFLAIISLALILLKLLPFISLKYLSNESK